MKWLIVTKERYTYGTAVKAPPKVIVPASRPVTKIDPCLLSVCVPAASATPSVNPCTTHTRTQCQRRMNGRREAAATRLQRDVDDVPHHAQHQQDPAETPVPTVHSTARETR